jgi:hypothetical protein
MTIDSPSSEKEAKTPLVVAVEASQQLYFGHHMCILDILFHSCAEEEDDKQGSENSSNEEDDQKGKENSSREVFGS